MTQSRTSLYKATIAKLKERYAGKLDILCGLEWDLFSDDDPYAYDYFIGSAHYVKGPKTGKYYEIDWREEDLRACIDDDFDGDGLAVAAETQRLQASLPCGYCHFLQRVFAVAQFGMNVNGTFQVLPGHITASFPA